MTTPAVHANKVKCRFCSQWRNPHEFDFPVIGHCWACVERHSRELAIATETEPPRECAICQTPTELLARDANGDLRLRLHPIDGAYGFVCEPCSGRYERKRADLYGDTPYGLARGLKTKT